MTSSTPTLFYDFVDPLSFLLLRELDSVSDAAGGAESVVAMHPFELRPPPAPLVTVDDDSLASRWKEALRLAGEREIVFAPPPLVPWTRKAHELVLFAAEKGQAEAMRRRVFEAHLLRGEDIGRVDVLVGLGVDLGLDRIETKAVLDVDRHQAEVVSLRDQAAASGVTSPPTLVFGEERVEGFHNRDRLGTLLGT